MLLLKQLIITEIQKKLDEKIESLQKSIESLKESRDNETKSSVGDKYETGRTMMQMELEKNRVQLNKTLALKHELAQINYKTKNNSAKFGSLVITNIGNYFISIGMGKMEIENETYFCISLASPIGKLLNNKKRNDTFIFQGKEIVITEIL